MIDFLINGVIPITLFSNMITFRDSNKSFKVDGDLLESMTNSDLNNDHSNQQDRLINNKNIKGKYQIGIYLKDLFRFAEHQEKGTYGLGYKLTLTGNTGKAVLNKAAATNNA